MTFKDWAGGLIEAGNVIVIPVLFGIAFIAFVWGIVNYFFLKVDSEEGKREGKQFVIWGLLGMVILFSAWGLVHILLDTLGWLPS